MSTSPGIALRTMTTADIDAGLRLCRLSQWNQVARDWQQFLELTPGGAAVATDDADVVIGSVASMRYAAAQRGAADSAPASMAWIAMVLVDPGYRGRGIGTALLQHGLTLAADADGVGLDATPLGQPLYEKLGFRTASTLLRMVRPAVQGAHTSPRMPSGGDADMSLASVRAAIPADVGEMASLDARATGLDRRAMIDWLRQGAPEFAHVSTNADAIDGFVLGRHGHDYSHIGPVIASSSETACALVGACLRARPAHRFVIDIAEGRTDWRSALEAIGLTQQRPFARMYRGDWRPVEAPGWIYASIGPEFG